MVLSIGFAERALGRTDAAADSFSLAARLGRLYGNEQAARWGVRYLALIRVTQGRLREAEAIIDEALDRVRADAADPGSMLPALLVSKAEVLIERNLLEEARPLLDQVISLIQRVGFSPRMKDMCGRSCRKARICARCFATMFGIVDAARRYAMGLLSEFNGRGYMDSAGSAGAPIDEPLTPRQLEILRLLADGRSNRQIAAELFIAEGTVKAHMHQLFGKLMVRNRTEAVVAARELRLLAP